MEKYEKKLKEKIEFEKAVKAVREHDDQESTQLIDNFLKSKKIMTNQLLDPSATLTRSERLRTIKKMQDELDRVSVPSN